jgi:predicted dehydrogenase
MPDAKPVGTVLIGCGAVSTLYYAPALQELQKSGVLRVVGLFDPSPDNAARLKRVFPEASRHDGLGQLSKTDAELAIVASPPRYHAEQTIQLLQAGLSVLCEKPMATCIAEGEAMVDAAANTPGVLAIGLLRRFFPATQTIRDILAQGMLGDIVSFDFAEGDDFKWPVASPDYFQKRAASGGVLADIGVHALDLLTWWWGSPDEMDYADDAMGGVEANCRIQTRFARGFGGEIRLSRDWPLRSRYVIEGKNGWLRWEVNEADRVEIGLRGSRYALKAHLFEHLDEQTASCRPAASFHQSFIDQLRNVVATIRGHEQLHVSADEGLPSLKLIEDCYRHRKLMSMPWLGEAEERRARELAKAG